MADDRVATPAAALTPLDHYRMGLEAPRQIPMLEHLGIRMVEVDHGRIVFEGQLDRRFYNPMGTIHGGYSGALLDTALGCAIHTACPAGYGYTTLEYKVTLLKAMTEATGTVRCEGRVLRVGSRVGYAEGEVKDAAGVVYAHGTTTCLVFPI